ncbi:MAG TPA: VWA domain-containing protein [Casimicrobiaceae bacterium]|nr:VWA domain-containing protein [Casimicrobiaceae bacterium]
MIAAHVARFAGTLRSHGVGVSLGDEVDAVVALPLVDLLDRTEVRLALRIALKVPRDAWREFDRLFDAHWGGRSAPEVPAPPPADSHRRRGPLEWRWDGTRVRLEAPEVERSGDEAPAYSPEALLRRKPFDRIPRSEIAAMERLASRLALRLAARRSRRLVPASGRGLVDLRRSLRRGLATEGDMLRLARRERALDEPRLVLLYDTSGSMEPYTRFHLAFALALRRAIRRVEIFAFNTSLTRVSRAVARARTSGSLDELASEVPDWSGGTRIGACLAEFLTLHGDRVGRDTTVVIVSDGLDLGETDLLAESMRALRGRARMVVWMNPLAGDRRYEPAAAGMRAALPHVDHLAPGHDLASLERLTRLLN